MVALKSSQTILLDCIQNSITLDQWAINYESRQQGISQEALLDVIKTYFETMKSAIKEGLDYRFPFNSKIINRDTLKLKQYIDSNQSLLGNDLLMSVLYALATMEVNVSMGRVVAAPTAGSCGVLPGVLVYMQERYAYDQDSMIRALLVAGLVGTLIAKNASISGAKGGCQAEIGSAAAMASAAIVFLRGGTMEAQFHSAAITIKNVMGLICDPVAGLVEVPCYKRNAMGVSQAYLSADLALAGISSVIPFDEVVDAMKQVGDQMPSCFKETSCGGIAITNTGKELSNRIYDNGGQYDH